MAPLGAPDLRTGGAKFVQFLQISLKRAFRIRIDSNEVLPEERAALPGQAPDVQAFLAWRRSVLFIAAVLLVPAIVLQAIDTFDYPDGTPGALIGLTVIDFLVNTGFVVALFVLLRRWNQWHAQRRTLAIASAAFVLTPFVLYLYPLRTVFDGPVAKLGLGLAFSLLAILSLAPKALALAPGVLRASLVTKHLLPGSAAPGWIVAITAPMFALLLFMVLVVPYQIGGSGWFLLAIGGLIAGQVWMARAGYRLARPLHVEQAAVVFLRARTPYLALTAVGLLCLVIGLWDLVSQLSGFVSKLSIFSVLLLLLVDVLVFTLISADVMLAALTRAHGLTEGDEAQAARDECGQTLARLEAGGAIAVGGPMPAPPMGGAPVPMGGPPGGTPGGPAPAPAPSGFGPPGAAPGPGGFPPPQGPGQPPHG